MDTGTLDIGTVITKTLAKARATPAIFAVVALVTFVVPALLGHPIIIGDNATQNISLRWLTGQLELHGHLPSWDPYNWSGTPLEAGFNAGSFYPLIVFFIVLPATWAFTFALTVVWFLAQSTLYLIAKHLGIRRGIATAAAVVFVMTGAFASQIIHIDMLEGDLGLLVAFLAIIKVIDSNEPRVQYRWGALLAVGFGTSVLAGAPEAMLSALVLLGTLTTVRALQRALTMRAVATIAVAAALALGLSAIQWVPGLAFTAISNRNHLPPHYAGAGSLGWEFLPLFAFPFAYGSYSGNYIPSYFGNYNPSEITTSLGVVALVAIVIALAGHQPPGIRRGTRVLLVSIAAVGSIFALGSYTPIAHLIYRLPLFSLQRLASRYSIDLDAVLILLAAVGVTAILEHTSSPEKHHLARYATVALGLGATLFSAAIEIVPKWTLTHLNVSSVPTGGPLLGVRIYLLCQLALIWWMIYAYLSIRPTLQARHRATKIMLIITAVNLVNFGAQFFWIPVVHKPLTDTAGVPAQTLLTPTQRYGLYDPRLYLYGRAINANVQLDRNVFIGVDSIQGYASLALASYNAATHTKLQSTLQPDLINFYHQALNMDLLITSPYYFLKPLASSSIPIHQLLATPSLPRLSGSRPRGAWFTGGISGISSITLRLPPPIRAATLHVIGKGWSTTVPIAGISSSGTTLNLPRWTESKTITEISITTDHTVRLTDTHRVIVEFNGPGASQLLDGPLLNHISPTAWRDLTGKNETLDFVNLHPISGYIHQTQGVSIANQVQRQDGTVTATLSVNNPVTTRLALADAPGWTASTSNGRVLPLTNSNGLMALHLPAGTYHLTLRYQAPRLKEGILITLGSAAVLAFAVLVTSIKRRTVGVVTEPDRPDTR
ncbi:MAG: hypothetical protein ACYDHP_03740 [Ferrimicrobium sp.]